ncbi:DUF5050 domain-containing protein [Clostridium ganghwense]|uniref:DUF5050 domain-containing protein n=1 Tax=Clostridium ganghwense TaxID=312089 RepID=A0ABT4CPZ9_9CLOT|nr:DUF5050 domain-containing protein [Clostridium ganghwense]MCY6370156.1 DUF5050 domain-containing protein [Clostridium ganghwense]
MRKYCRNLVTVSMFAMFAFQPVFVQAKNIPDGKSVDSNKAWKIRFSDSVEVNDNVKKSIVVKDSKNNEVKVSITSADNGEAILVKSPVNGYKKGENYVLTIEDKIYSKNNKKLNKKVDFKFDIKNDIDIPENSNIELGNTSGNTVNQGWVTEKDDFLYFTSSQYWDVADLYKMKKDGTGLTKINKKKMYYASNLNIVGDWLYYELFESGEKDWQNNLYKVKTDGTGDTKVLDNAESCVITGDSIYYVNRSDENKLYKAALDGSNKVKLCDDEVTEINLSGNWIIYNTIDNEYFKNLRARYVGSIYKIKTDGTNKIQLTKNEGYHINTVGNEVYYINHSDNNKIYKVSLDGSKDIKVSDDSAFCLNVNDGWIYYSNDSDPIKMSTGYSTMECATLYKMQIDGTQKTKLRNVFSTDINVSGEWIYYKEYFDTGMGNGEIRKKINKNGTGDKDVEYFQEQL